MRYPLLSLLAALLFFTAPTDLLAQSDARLGVKVGLNSSTFTLDNAISTTGLHGGLLFRSDPVRRFGYQAELLYSSRGANWHVGLFGLAQDVSVRLDHIDLPVMAVFRPIPALELHGGAYAGYLLSAAYKATGILINETGEVGRGNFNALDLGVLAGVAMNLGPVQIGGRYNFGLTKVSDSFVTDLVLGEAKNRWGQLFLAYMIADRT